MVGAAVLDRTPQIAAVPGGGLRCCGGAGFVLSAVHVLVLRELGGAEDGLTAGELASATAAARTVPIAPAVTALEARGLACGHERCGAGQRREWAWSLTSLGRQSVEAMRSGAIVEIGDRRLVAAGELGR